MIETQILDASNLNSYEFVDSGNRLLFLKVLR